MRRPKLETKDAESFFKEGLLIIEDILAYDDRELLKSRFPPLFNGEYETGLAPDKVKWIDGLHSPLIPRSLLNPWKSDPTVARFSLDPWLGEAAAYLMGWSGTRINQDVLMWLAPNAGSVAFHQDVPYHDWHVPDDIITCWIPLTDTTSRGGTLEYVAGSHLWPAPSRRVVNFFEANDVEGCLSETAKSIGKAPVFTPVVVSAGSAVFINGHLWHGSRINQTLHERFTLIAFMMSSDATFHPMNKSPVFSRYQRCGDLGMDESFFPIIWTKEGYRTKFLAQ